MSSPGSDQSRSQPDPTHYVVDVEVEDIGSETSKNGNATEAGTDEDLLLLENTSIQASHDGSFPASRDGSVPASRDGSEFSGFSRGGTGSRESGSLPDKVSVNDLEDAALPRVESGRHSGSESRSSRQTSTSSELRLHLDMKEKEDDERKMAERRAREEEVAKVRQKLEEERRKKGVQILPGSRESRGVIQAFLSKEDMMAMEDRQQELATESEDMRSEIENKYGFSQKNKPTTGLVAMAAEFYSSKEMPNEVLPERIRRNLTTQEIRDLKLVFDMFDAKGRGYIISYDLKKAAGMLGFRAKKQVFKEMIDELATDQKGKVTFINFLDFILKSQGEGPDPYEEIIQCFQLLDTDDKGFLTFSDLRSASDYAHLSLSNKALREMLQEADLTGDGRITEIEFVRIMMETNTFRLTSKGRTRLK